MAIKIAGTEVIDGSRAVVNMNNIEGKYSQFQGSATIITTVLDMSKPIMRRTLSAPTTFTASNIATGKCAILMLDVSSSGHLPTWPSSIQWPGDGTEPDWDATGVQHWDLDLAEKEIALERRVHDRKVATRTSGANQKKVLKQK